MNKEIIFLVTFFYFGYAASPSLPLDFFSPCPIDEYKVCLTEKANLAAKVLITGDPGLKISPLNPVVLPFFQVFSSEALSFNLTNINVYGVDKLQILRIDSKPNSFQFLIEAFLPNVTALCEYSGRGQILPGLPLDGEGPAKIEAYNTTVLMKLNYTLYRSKGQEHIRIRKYDLKASPDDLHIKFDNLSNGDEKIGERMNTFFNRSWPMAIGMLQPTVNAAISKILKRLVPIITRNIALKDIFQL